MIRDSFVEWFRTWCPKSTIFEGGVHNQQLAVEQRRLRPAQTMSRVYPVILVGALLIASLYATNYTSIGTAKMTLGDSPTGTPIYGKGAQRNSIYPYYPASALTVFELNITVNYSPSSNAYVIEPKIKTVALNPAANGTTSMGTTTVSEKGIQRLYLGLNISSSYLEYNSGFFLNPKRVVVGNETITTGTLIPIGTNAPVLSMVNPNGTVSTWILQSPRFNGGNFGITPEADITQPGTYRFFIAITNSQYTEWSGDLLLTESWQFVEKPYLYYGFAGLIIALGYLAFVSVNVVINMKNKNSKI
jgi:hypothetical protein